MSHIVKGFCIVNKAEIDVFLELSCFSNNPADVGNLISGSSAFSKTSLNIWNFTVHVLLRPGLENFEHDFTRVWKVKVKLKSLSPVWLFVTPWTVASQTSPLMWFSMQEYQSGLLFPPPGDLPYPGIKPASPALQEDTLTSEPLGSMWDECDCGVGWTFFGIAFLWDWNENWPIPVLWPLLNFPNLLAYWVQHFHSIIC